MLLRGDIVRIGDRILRLLQNKQITQKQLAQQLNISYSTLNGYVNNNREPDYTTIIAIANYFDVSVDYLVGSLGNRQMDDLSAEELTLIELFRFLYDDQREFFIEQLKLILKQNSKNGIKSTGIISEEDTGLKKMNSI